jgi:hypothetical protein
VLTKSFSYPVCCNAGLALPLSIDASSMGFLRQELAVNLGLM